MAGGLAHADEAAAPMDEGLYRRGYCRILPFGAAAVGSVSIAHVDEHVDAIQQLGVLADIVKGDELHVEGRAGQGLNDPGVGVVLLLVQGMVDHVAAP